MKSLTIRIIAVALCVLPTLVSSCSRPDRSEKALALSDELQNLAISDMDTALERVDSARRAGLFTAVKANTIKACIYENADLRRMAAYYAEKAIAAGAGHAITTTADSSDYCTVRWILADVTYANGEYGKSLALAREVLAFTGNSTSPYALAMKCRALSQMADCESELHHLDQAERLLLQSIDILMEDTRQATSFSDIAPIFYSLLSLSDLYIDNGMADRALPLHAIMDTAMNRLTQCPDTPEWVVQLRRNNVTISKAMAYAANGQRAQAEALLREHRQSPNLDVADKTAEGICLSIMGRYDEAVRLFDEADSMKRANGDVITNVHVRTLLLHKYDALQKAGRTAEALAMADQIRQLTDSLRLQERQADVEQLQEIKRQEEEIVRKQQSLSTQRIVIIATVILLLMAIFIIWRVRQDNRLLTEKNRHLYELIQQRELAQAMQQRQLQAQPEENISPEQRLYRRLCRLMEQQHPYTDEHLNRDTLAELLGTNTKYLAQAIHTCSHGDTVGSFINRYRLEHVALLLKTTNDTIGLIGELSGLPNRVTLSRLFRQAYGMTCSEYRQVAQQK